MPKEANANLLGDALSFPLRCTEPLISQIDLDTGDNLLSEADEGRDIVDTDTPIGGAMRAASLSGGTKSCSDACVFDII
ncbi:hypothetical protein DYI22_04105 [Marinobacter lipolyticus]|nr:hypothetical protein [Marinobacter lipolyticus]